MAQLKFETLWDNYPDSAPCNTEAFSNQCAIKVGSALAKSGIKTTNLVSKARHCWFHDVSEGHVLAAQELANGLEKLAIPGVRKAIKVTGKDFKERLAGKKGIIFFKDYWMRNSDKPNLPTGDHIDLWNGSRLTDWKTWFRIQWGIVIPNVWSDLTAADEVLFWQIDQ